VAEAIAALFGWHRNLTENDVARVLEDWTRRIETQRDYNALIDWLSLVLHPEVEVPPALRKGTWDLLVRRAEYPAVGKEGWDWARLAGAFVVERPMELGRLIVDLIESEGMTIHKGDDEAVLLGKCVSAEPRLWVDIAERLVGGSWRLQIELRGWLLHHVSPETVEDWVGDSIERARVVASVAPVGGAEPSPFARFLLGQFGDDEEIQSSLYGSLVTGFWTGNESDRIANQIEQLTAWRTSPSEPLEVRKWAREIIEILQQARSRALRREAEEGF
jgi:hypothetical protein